MFKHWLVLSLVIMAVVTQDMPPPDLDITTDKPATTTESELIPETTTTAEEFTITTEETANSTTTLPTTTEEVITTTTPAIDTTLLIDTTTTTTTPKAITTTSEVTTTAPETTTTRRVPSSTIRNDEPISPVTDSPYTTPAPLDPHYPGYPNYSGHRCYYKKQYGYPQIRWSCHHGFKYFYPVECYKCCAYNFSLFAGCYQVQGHHCNRVNHAHGVYK